MAPQLQAGLGRRLGRQLGCNLGTLIYPLSVCLSVCVSVCLCQGLPVLDMVVRLPIYRSTDPFICLSVNLPLHFVVCPCCQLAACVSARLSACRTAAPSMASQHGCPGHGQRHLCEEGDPETSADGTRCLKFHLPCHRRTTTHQTRVGSRGCLTVCYDEYHITRTRSCPWAALLQ